ncbi:conserved hypothetical protein [Ixodes scapularis]|uniref:Uncharacterized protein n=1 Tax=Ixodes scapularis TaxID=6945 RepID=B7QBU6_IXOSC|nr:conserved hypothetical protein [Ixodes scapularis]|eukprot:XP_002413010.1 conserved hypothetical protein [Ixodes scapularis]
MSQGGASLYQDHILQAVLQGNLTSVPEPPSRVLKILVASTRHDLDHERRVVQENVVPELQRHCASLGLDVQLLDLQQGPDPRLCLASTTLQELEDCHARSLGCFLICLIGNKYGPLALPDLIESSTFEQVHNAAQEAGLDVSPLANWYLLNENLVHPAYELQVPQTPDPVADRTSEPDGCILVAGDAVAESRRILEEQEQVSKVLRYGARVALDEGLIDVDTERQFRMSSINMSDASVSSYVDVSAQDGGCTDEETSLSADDLVADIILNVNKKNVHYYCVPWQTSGLDPEFPEHGGYLEKLAECLLSSVKQMVDDASQLDTPDWDELPPTFRKEVVRESQTHLCNSRQLLGALGVSQSLDSDYGPLLQIQRLMLADEERARHTPIIVCGREGCGKSTLLSQVLMYCPEWLGNDVVRIIRGVGQSPFCAYTAEILRNLCLHISMVFGFEISPKHHSFELSKLSIWFQDLLKLVETTTSDLVIVLDDLHQLKCPPNNQAAILGWLPWNLPLNVHIVCSVAEEAEGVLGLLRSRISTSDSYVHIPSLQGSAAASMLQSNLKDHKRTLTKDQWGVVRDRLAGQSVCPLYVTLLSQQAKRWSSYEALDGDMHVPGDIGTFVNRTLEKSEKRFGFSHVKKIASYLTCTSYGLREPEIVELLSCSECEASQREFLPVNWLSFKRELDGNSKVLEDLVSQANSWCNQAKTPLLVPLTSWLSLTLPPQVTSMSLQSPLKHLVAVPDSQHVFCTTEADNRVISMYHVTSKKLVRQLSGHKATITCLHMSASGRHLVSGSEDTDVLIWDPVLGTLQRRLSHHVAGVLCVATTHSEDFVLSGSEIGVVVVARLDTGQLVQRLENHRGVVNAVAVNKGDDIFATASSDCTVCVWCLEDFTLLNSIALPSAIVRLCISSDSTFLLLACADNVVRVRSLTTGSDVHCLQGYTGRVSTLSFARDNCRCVVGTGDGKAFVFDIHSARLVQTLVAHQDSAVVAIQAQSKDTFLITAAGNKIVVWNFYLKRSEMCHPQPKAKKVDVHKDPVSCVALSRDGSMGVTGSRNGQIKVWQMSIGEPHTNLEGHTAAITCLVFAPNGLFVVSGSEDNTVRVWGLSLGVLACTFKEHQSKPVSVFVTSDSRRILSVDAQGVHRLWTADNATQLIMCTRTCKQVILHANMVFNVGGKSDNSLKYWPVMDTESEKTVSHSEAILCYTVTYDCQTVVTGSQDMSLKVWEVATAKLTQVLVGHEGPVTCVAVAPFRSSLAVSGSQDCNLIVWDMTTGSDNFILRGHTESIKATKLTLDGTVAVSCSDDNTLQLWNTQNGHRIASFDLHATMLVMTTSLNTNHLIIQLASSTFVPMLKMLNNPGKGLMLDLPPGTPVSDESKTLGLHLRGMMPKRVLLRGNLKREQSFDSFYWDLRAQSPKHETVDDFRMKPLSPFGSREHLHLSGTTPVWNGGVSTGRGLRPGGHPSDLGLQPKPKLPKHKILKKQQSMFACFPEFTQQAPPTLISPVTTAKDIVEKKELLLGKPSRVAAAMTLPRTNSVEEAPEKAQDEGAVGPENTVTDSAVCVVM